MITPIQEQTALAQAIGLGKISFKREDLHPYGSHKGRSIPVMIDHYLQAGDRKFAISSSGNAALAAALYLREKHQKEQIDLDIFVGQRVSAKKLDKLRHITNEHIRVLVKERPLQALNQAVADGYRSLRQSTDDVALKGYETLAQEIVSIKKAAAVFIGTSSGTTAQALAQYFIKEKKDTQVHIVQTSSCHPFSQEFDAYDGPDEISIADAIVDQTAMRKGALIPLIEETGGRGWFATNDEIRSAQKLVETHSHLNISTNSALSVVGAMQAAYTGYEIPGIVICMICGE